MFALLDQALDNNINDKYKSCSAILEIILRNYENLCSTIDEIFAFVEFDKDGDFIKIYTEYCNMCQELGAQNELPENELQARINNVLVLAEGSRKWVETVQQKISVFGAKIDKLKK